MKDHKALSRRYCSAEKTSLRAGENKNKNLVATLAGLFPLNASRRRACAYEHDKNAVEKGTFFDNLARSSLIQTEHGECHVEQRRTVLAFHVVSFAVGQLHLLPHCPRCGGGCLVHWDVADADDLVA